jgi:hypothetical protein
VEPCAPEEGFVTEEHKYFDPIIKVFLVSTEKKVVKNIWMSHRYCPLEVPGTSPILC